MKQLLLGLGIALIAATGLYAMPVSASSAPVKLFISGTTLTINGHASPNALVEVKKDGAIIGSVVADSTGFFSKYFSAMDAGLNTLAVSYRDQFGTLSDTVTRTINVKAQQNTALYYYLPPTLSLSNNNIIEGSNQSAFGYTRPFATVKLTVDGGALVLNPQADQNGYYSIAFSTKNYYTGRHIINAYSSYENTSSPTTETRIFNVSGNRPTILSRELTPPSFSVENPLIAGGSTTITGLAPPNSQLIFYQNDVAIGSSFANSEGNWAFNFNVTQNSFIQVVSCYGEDCSARSDKLNILFRPSDGQLCGLDFSLTNYRYFDQHPQEEVSITLAGINASPPLVVQVDWGDGETTDISLDSTNTYRLSHIYDENGQFNGSVSILDNNNCGGSKFFSVEVNSKDNFLMLLWLIPVFTAIAGATYLKLRNKEITEDQAKKSLDKI